MARRLSHLRFAYNFEGGCKSHAEGLPVEGFSSGSHQASLPFKIWPAPTQER